MMAEREDKKTYDAFNQHARLVEAILFASESPLSAPEIYERMPEGADVGAVLKHLKDIYAGRGVNLVEREGKWAFRTAADLGDALVLEKVEEKKLSRAGLETLAIIAYHQPVTRAEIENIRGVATHRGTLDTLVEAGWVKPGRRRESPGRPVTWVTTNAFLDHFALESIMDLPGLDELKASGMLDRRPAIETLGKGGGMTAEMFDSEDDDTVPGAPGNDDTQDQEDE